VEWLWWSCWRRIEVDPQALWD